MDAEELAIMEEFIVEGFDMLDEVEPKLIQLQQSNSLPESEKSNLFNAVFRVFHSMKGTAGILPLPNISTLVHTAESLLSLFRKGQAVFRAEHTSVFLQAVDLLRKMFTLVENEKHDQGFEETVNAVCDKIKLTMKAEMEFQAAANPAPAPGCISNFSAAPKTAPAASPDSADGLNLEIPITPEMISRFTSEAEELLEQIEQQLLGLQKHSDPEGLNHAFRFLHSFKGNCGFMGLQDLEHLSHAMESSLEEVKNHHVEFSVDMLTLFLELVDILRKTVNEYSKNGNSRIENPEKYLRKLSAFSKPGEPQNMPETPTAKAAAIQATASQMAVAPVRQDIRVGLGKLDTLINLVGELVIAEAMVTRHPAITALKAEGVEQVIHQLRRVSQDLQDVALSVRMIPLTSTFHKMIRLAHDLSAKSGKQVELELKGGDTEVDKTVSELIADPLVHIVRNSIDHGLETAEVRRSLGKPETGHVTIEARHESGEVWILIRDDGRGLSREKIIQKAIEKNMIPGDGQNLSDRQVHKLIFEPGFSTADKITDISGRGVGLDVVKKNVEKMKGRIDIHTENGKGTTFILRIPLTLAIIEGMLVRLGDTRYTIPMLAIRESFRPQPDQISTLPEGGEIVRVRNTFYPLIRLHAIFQKPGAIMEPHAGILVLVEVENQKACILVDEILGQQEIVIKGLSKYLGEARGISGCTILGDGEVSLVLDIGTLISFAAAANKQTESKNAHSTAAPISAVGRVS